MSNNENNQSIENLLNAVASRLGKSPEELQKAAQSGDISSILSNLNSKDSEKIQNVLSNKDAANSLLSSPQAQSLIKKMLGDN